jgi:hypothetical protein
VIKYKQLRQRLGQEAAAAKVGISERTARRLERLDGLPSQRAPRTWRTRSDPLAAVWETEVLPMLRGAPDLTAVTVLEELTAPPSRRLPERRLVSPSRSSTRHPGERMVQAYVDASALKDWRNTLVATTGSAAQAFAQALA